MHPRSKADTAERKRRKRALSAAYKETAAKWYVRLILVYAAWQVVGLVLGLFAQDFVYETSMLLNITNIPSYPSIFSFFLLTLIALGLLRRLRPALWLSVALWQMLTIVLILTMIVLILTDSESESDITNGFTNKAAVILVVIAFVVAIGFIVLAAWMSSAFPARLAPGAWQRAGGVIVLGLSASVALTFSILEISTLGRLHFRDAINWSVSVALGMSPSSPPFHSRIEGPSWLEFTASSMSSLVLLFAISVFLRAAPHDAQQDKNEELAIRRLLLTAEPSDSLGYFATRDDRQVVFSPDGRAAVSYRVILGVCLAAGDPIGDRQSWPQAIRHWLDYARSYGWVPAAISVSESAAHAYRTAGLHPMSLGDEAVIQVSDFHLGSAGLRTVRKAVAGPVNAGYRVQVRRQCEIPSQELDELVHAADLWRRGGPERGFSMASGRLGDARDARTVIVTAHDDSGRVCGLLSFVPWGRRDLSLDVMRRSPEAISGVTELMVTELLAASDQLGVTKISLNFAMFRESFARGSRIGASPLQRFNRKLLLVASRWWQLHSLYQSNEKYMPRWRPRLLCYDSTAQLTQVLAAVLQAEGFIPELPPRLFQRRSRAAQLDMPETAAQLAGAVRAQEKELLAPVIPGRRMSEQQRVRHEKLERLVEVGIDPYPTDVARTTSLAQLAPTSGAVSVVGRVVRIRDHGGVLFADVREGADERQVMFTADRPGARVDLWRTTVDRGDLVSVSGQACLSRSGELSVHVESWTMAAKCLTPPPDKHLGLRDPEARVRLRQMDLALDSDARRRLLARSAVVRGIREKLAERGFAEVETPILQRVHGGANARPFTTHINAYDLDLTLRIAPELYLKRLCVGGIERVFEIGRNFRNEGADSTHNPEFTSLEAYQAFADYTVMRELTQELLCAAASAVHGDAVAPRPDGSMLRLDGQWRVIPVHEAVARATGSEITPDTPVERLRELCDEHRVHYSTSMTCGDLVSELYEELVEPTTTEPTFYTDFPVETSPLTRKHRRDPRLAERWDLVAFGMELGTAYTELTNPIDQRERLTEQSLRAAAGDPEAMEVDEDFLAALEFGMPPTGGLGLGVDRMAMFLLGVPIRETLAFPFVRPNTHSPGS